MANSSWFGDNALIYEGATADDFEFYVDATDFTGGADVVLRGSFEVTYQRPGPPGTF
jgi:hypothetical protein